MVTLLIIRHTSCLDPVYNIPLTSQQHYENDDGFMSPEATMAVKLDSASVARNVGVTRGVRLNRLVLRSGRFCHCKTPLSIPYEIKRDTGPLLMRGQINIASAKK